MLPFYFKQGKDYKMQETIIIEGYVEHLRFRNEENGYTVFNLEMKQDEITCIGKFPFISEGQYLELTGYEFDNKQYNEIQFQVLAYEEKQVEDMNFGWRIVKHVKSNAIVVVGDGHTFGVGAGQMNRVGSARIALEQAKEALAAEGKDILSAGLTLASDGFFPFDDSVELAAQYGIKAIVQPGGSVRDEDSIKKADECGITMLFTGMRHFKH